MIEEDAEEAYDDTTEEESVLEEETDEDEIETDPYDVQEEVDSNASEDNLDQ